MTRISTNPLDATYTSKIVTLTAEEIISKYGDVLLLYFSKETINNRLKNSNNME